MRKFFLLFIFYFLQVETSLANTSEKKDLFICQLSLNDTKDGWSKDWPKYVKEAKQRGFSPRDCHKIRMDQLYNPNELKDELFICQLASNSNWNGWSKDWPEYVEEAKRRGLSPSDCRIIGYGDKFPFGQNTLPPNIKKLN
mgnify:CR=1